MISRVKMHRTLLGAAAVATLISTGCVEQQRVLPEIPTRRVLPVSVCTTQLAPPARGDSDKAVIRSLDPEQWLQIMIPSYEIGKGVNPTDIDCTGHYVFANEMLRHGVALTGWPRKIDPEELELRAGPGGLRVLWLPVLAFENGDVGGPVAMVRGIDDRAEVYGIGSYKGPEGTKLSPVRMGNETIVVAEAKRCPEDPRMCRKEASFYLMRRGRLLEGATVDTERVARLPSMLERGLYTEYRMTTDITYQPDGIHLLEQVKVKIIPYENQGDRDSNRLLRTVEFRRLLQVERDALFATNESVWERVVGLD